jgi:hypothetical protein
MRGWYLHTREDTPFQFFNKSRDTAMQSGEVWNTDRIDQVSGKTTLSYGNSRSGLAPVTFVPVPPRSVT